MHDPELMLFDEPTSGLDPINQQEIFDIITERIESRGATLFLSSHILTEVERVCDRVGVIREGRLVAEESIDDIIAKAIRKVRVTYEEPVSAESYAHFPGISNVEQVDERTVRARVTENLDGAIRALMDHTIRDISVAHASLEEIFFEYYARAGEAPPTEPSPPADPGPGSADSTPPAEGDAS
jgi:ABC-2 type transport system ATP-binding protein